MTTPPPRHLGHDARGLPILAPRTMPAPRGPLSAWTLDRLRDRTPYRRPAIGDADPLGEDAQLALYLSYELHYNDPRFDRFVEWDHHLLDLRHALERGMELELASWLRHTVEHEGPMSEQILALIAAEEGPSLSERALSADLDQLRDLVRQRSFYHRKEADGHSFAIARLEGRTKQCFVQIQAGEYGADAPGRQQHAELYAQTMRSLGLDATPNAHLDEATAEALLISNLVSLFALNRRWKGAVVGHLAAFECTSVEPMGRYVRALRAAGAPEEALRFYEVHVRSDVEHQALAREMVDELALAQPELQGQILFGAAAALLAEERFAATMIERWAHTPELVEVPAPVVGLPTIPVSTTNHTTKGPDHAPEVLDSRA